VRRTGSPYRPPVVLGALCAGNQASRPRGGMAIADATVKRARDALLLHKRKGIVRLVGLQHARSARWAQVA
jgi:hypothetical protein